jgi:glucan phosphoethanolaminetransferase (alkaline phosphatase superfamily)
MAYNLKVIIISLITVFVAIFGLFYIVDNISRIMKTCETNKNLNICTLGSLPVIILVALLIIGGMIMIINITAYILLSGRTRA